MDSFEEQLAEAVRGYEHLYNTSTKAYKDIQMSHNSWCEIAQLLGVEEDVCRKRWRYLRDKFAKAKRRVAVKSKKSGGPGGGKASSPPALYLLLQWLDPHIKHREGETNFVVVEDQTEDSPQDDHVSQLATDHLSHSPSPLNLSATSSTFSGRGKRKKSSHPEHATELTPYQAEIIKRLDGSQTKFTENEHYLLSLAPTLDRLDHRKQAMVKLRFQQALFDIEFGE